MIDYIVNDMNKKLEKETLKNFKKQIDKAFNDYNKLCQERDDYIESIKDLNTNVYGTFELDNDKYVCKILSISHWCDYGDFRYNVRCFGLTKPFFSEDYCISESDITLITEEEYKKLTKKALKLIANAV